LLCMFRSLYSVYCLCVLYCCHRLSTQLQLKIIIYVCFDFSATSVWNIFNSRKNWTRSDKKMYIVIHVKYLLFLTYFDNASVLYSRVSPQISNVMNIRSVGA
jgi:hypothetical protein